MTRIEQMRQRVESNALIPLTTDEMLALIELAERAVAWRQCDHKSLGWEVRRDREADLKDEIDEFEEAGDGSGV